MFSQIQQALAPIRVDPKETWKACKFNHSTCDSNQMQILQGMNHLISFIFNVDENYYHQDYPSVNRIQEYNA